MLVLLLRSMIAIVIVDGRVDVNFQALHAWALYMMELMCILLLIEDTFASSATRYLEDPLIKPANMCQFA